MTTEVLDKISIEEEFSLQLADFLRTTAEEEDYKRFTPLRDKILVKLFKFSPSDNDVLGKSSVLVQSKLDGQWKPKDAAIHEKVFPICKIIKAGKDVDPRIQEGQLYTVPFSDVVGEDWNPDFMFLMQNFTKQGNKMGLADIPPDMRQRIPKLEKNWERYKFSMPDRIGKESDEDRLVYLIPELKLESEYEPNI